MTTLNTSSREFSSLAADLLRRGHSLRFRAYGRSMVPVILPGDVLTVVPASGEDLQKGDVALYRRPGGEPVVHRVVRKAATDLNPRLYLAGDAQAEPPEPVEFSRILGRATRVEHENVSCPLDHPNRNRGALWQAHCRRRSRRLLRIAGRCRTLLTLP